MNIRPDGRTLQKRIAGALFSLFALCFITVSSVQSANIPPGGNIVRATLKNGLRVVVIENALAPVATVYMNYLAGASEDPQGLMGTAHAQEHMMFRGSPGLSAEQLAAITAAMGGNVNADTQQTITQYISTVPADDIDIALHIEAVRMEGVLDSQRLWEQERGAIEQEVAQDLSNPEYVFYTKLLAQMFRDTPYAHDGLGSNAAFDKMTGEMLRKFHNDWYAPNNAVLVIVGNVNPKKTLKSAERLFAGIPGKKIPQKVAIDLKPLKAAEIKLETDLPYSVAFLAYRLPGYDSPDFAAGQVLGDILESKRANIYALVPQGKALSIDVGISTLPKAAIGYVSAAYPTGEDGGKLIATMKGIIADYLKNGFPPELVEAAKRGELAAYELQKNSIEGLGSLWSQALAVEGRDSPEDDVSAISRVTAEDVNRVARKYLINETAITALLEPGKSGKTITAKGAKGKESFAARHVRHVRMPVWAKKISALPQLPVSLPGPRDIMLPNGLRLIVLPTNISDTVSIFGRVKNRPELQVQDGHEGVERVMNSLFAYGTKTLDRLEFQKALDDIAATETAGTDFSLQVLTGHLEKGVQLLADNLLNPAMPGDAFEIVRQETSGQLAGLLQSPSYQSKRALLSAIYPANDPILRQATPQTVTGLKLEDVKDYYSSIFRPDMTTMVVIGNITPDQAMAVIGKYFGDWKSSGPKPETDLPAVPSSKPSSSIVPDASRVQDLVTLAETLGITRSDPDYYTLELARHVLSGGFYATRLYQDLRERTGLVYSVEAFLQATRHRSVLGFVYACDPKNASRAHSIVVRNLREMQMRPITPKELRQAQTLLIHQISLSQSSVRSIAEKLLELSMADLPLDEPLRAAKRYREITTAEIKSAFIKWIRPGDLAQVTLGPNPK